LINLSNRGPCYPRPTQRTCVCKIRPKLINFKITKVLTSFFSFKREHYFFGLNVLDGEKEAVHVEQISLFSVFTSLPNCDAGVLKIAVFSKALQ